MNKQLSSVLKYAFFLLLGVFLLWLASKNVDYEDIKMHFENANYYWLIPAFACTVLAHYSRAVRWNMLIEPLGHKPKSHHTFYSVMIGYLVNLGIPRLGEIARCGSISRQERLPLNSVIGTIIVERGFDLIMMLLIMAVTLLLQLDKLGAFLTDSLNINFEDSGSLIWYMIIALVVILVGYLGYRITMVWVKASKFYFKIRRLIVGFLVGFKTVRKMKSPGLFLMHTVFIWLLYAGMTYFVFFTLEETSQLNYFDGITIMIIGSLGIVAPVPGGIGAYHYVISTALITIYGVNSGSALAYAWIMYISQSFFIIGLGGLSFFMLLLSKRKQTENESPAIN